MKSTSLLIAIAALAVTASTAQAFNGTVLREAGLSEDQVAAFSIARELSREGDTAQARDILLDAGIDESTIDRVRQALHQHRHSHRASVATAKHATTLADFQTAVAGTPLANIVTTEAAFHSFKAHQTERQQAKDRRFVRDWTESLSAEQAAALQAAHQANDKKAAHSILEEAGLVTPSYERHWQNKMQRRDFDS